MVGGVKYFKIRGKNFHSCPAKSWANGRKLKNQGGRKRKECRILLIVAEKEDCEGFWVYGKQR